MNTGQGRPPSKPINEQLPLWLGHPVMIGMYVFIVGVSAIRFGYTLTSSPPWTKILAHGGQVVMFVALLFMTLAVGRRRRRLAHGSRRRG